MSTSQSTLAWITPVPGNSPGQPPTISGGPAQPPVYPSGGPIPPPVDPGGGNPPGGGPGQPPTVGGGPAQPPGLHPGGGPIMPPTGPPPQLPELPGHPVTPLPPSGPPPVVSFGKPGGIPILPSDPNQKPPANPPAPPGTWVTLDAGKGQPPAWAYIPQDHGLGGAPPPVGPPGAPVVTPQGGAPPPSGAPAGHWVPVGTAPSAQPKDGGAASEPTWAYVPEISAQYGIKPPAAGPK